MDKLVLSSAGQWSPRLLFAGFLLILTCAILYLPGLDGPLFFDDRPALTANKQVQISGQTFDQWRVAALSSDSGPLRRPVAMLTFAINHVVAGGFSIPALKATNLAVHLGIGVILYFLFSAVLEVLQTGPDPGKRRMIALTAAAIWLLHPLNVSTVLYAVQRMAQLAAFFTLAGLLVFVRYRRRWVQHGASVGEVLAAALWLVLFTMLAALSKENGALLPWLVVVLEVCLFRGNWAGRHNRYLAGAAYLALLLPVVLVLALLQFSPDVLTAGYQGREFTLAERVLTQARLLWRYLGWIVLPNINDMGFQHDDIPLSTGLLSPLTTALAVVGWPVLLAVCWLLRRRWPLLLLAVLFYLVGHSMESSVWPLEMVYEHRNYLPGTFACLVLASALVLPFTDRKNVSWAYPVSGALVILCLLLFVRVQTWSDELALSRINLAQHPESSRSNYFYANALLRHYRRGDERGLSESERRDSLLLSRHYFERMYQTNERDVAALVMLAYLDGQFFPDLHQQVDWLAKLERLLQTRMLQPSDWNALSTLFELFASEASWVDRTRADRLLELLEHRYPDSLQVKQFRYEYLASSQEPAATVMPLLRQAQAQAPTEAWIYYYSIYESARVQDVAGMYEGARQWLLNDPRRSSLHQIKSLFSDSGQSRDPVRD